MTRDSLMVAGFAVLISALWVWGMRLRARFLQDVTGDLKRERQVRLAAERRIEGLLVQVATLTKERDDARAGVQR